MMLTPQYVHLKPTSSPNNVDVLAPFAAVIIIDALVLPEWRQTISEWLVAKGCLYMMAWGNDCSLWDDCVDWANLKPYEKFKDMPADKLVTTTWHDDESIEEVFYFALNSALPFSPLIRSIIILDITDKPNEYKMLARFKTAQDELEKDQNYNAVSGAISDYGNKFVKATGGTLVERLNIMMPLLFFGFLCLLLWGLVDFLWPKLVHFLS